MDKGLLLKSKCVFLHETDNDSVNYQPIPEVPEKFFVT
jgi:hypothetical protein